MGGDPEADQADQHRKERKFNLDAGNSLPDFAAEIILPLRNLRACGKGSWGPCREFQPLFPFGRPS